MFSLNGKFDIDGFNLTSDNIRDSPPSLATKSEVISQNTFETPRKDSVVSFSSYLEKDFDAESNAGGRCTHMQDTRFLKLRSICLVY